MARLPDRRFAPHSEAFLTEVNAQLKQQPDAATRELRYARLKIQSLEERLRLRRIAEYGPAGEKRSALQLELLEEEPGVSSEEVQAGSGREALPEPSAAGPRKPHPGRRPPGCRAPGRFAPVRRSSASAPARAQRPG